MPSIVIDTETCGYCGGCVAVCHDEAIELIEVRLHITEACTLCNACVVFCPVGALERAEDE